jgi:hypothetical protein
VTTVSDQDVAISLHLVEDRLERAYGDARGIEPQQQLAAVLSRLRETVRLEGKGNIHVRRAVDGEAPGPPAHELAVEPDLLQASF